MDVRQEIETIVFNSDIPTSARLQVVEFFCRLWDEYMNNNNDVKIESMELKDLWFYIKLNLLSKIASFQNHDAYQKLQRELNLNAKKLLNHKFRQKSIFLKEGKYESL